MPNFTISITDEMKTEMDKYLEVSWSKVCREAIDRYLKMRKNPTPVIELGIDRARPEIYFGSGLPGLSFTTRVINKMGFEIVVDRILFDVRVETSSGRTPAAGSDAYLFKQVIGANSTGIVNIFLRMPIEKIIELDRDISSTFDCRITFTMFIEGFKNPYRREVTTRIPIDDWKKLVARILKTVKRE